MYMYGDLCVPKKKIELGIFLTLNLSLDFFGSPGLAETAVTQ